MSEKYEDLVREIRAYHADGHRAVDVVRLLHERLVEIQGDSFSAYTFTYCLFKAFDIDFQTAQQVQRWIKLGWGGRMSDSELEQLLVHLRPRLPGALDGCVE